MLHWALVIVSSVLLSLSLVFTSLPVHANEDTILDLSIEELLNLSVTVASKSNSVSLFDTPAAVYVITPEDIERSGATNIMDALRMVPGFHVMQTNANSWAVGARGFGKRHNARLLVLIDGRSYYQTYTGGVNWADIDYPLNDIERIEVVRGPGGTVWGTNATDGVINIVTKHGRDTVGTSVMVMAGSEVLGKVRARQGFQIGSWGESFLRFYGKAEKRGEGFVSTTNVLDGVTPITDANDGWYNLQFGTRFDKVFENDWELMITSDFRYSDINDNIYLIEDVLPFASFTPHESTSIKYHFLTRISKQFSENSNLWTQVYYDYWGYDDNEKLDNAKFHTVDLDSQVSFGLFGRQTITLGAGYRLYIDRTTGVGQQRFDPANRTLHSGTGFIQDEIELYRNHLWLTLGSKFETHTYTNFEWQPSARLRFKLNDSFMVWSSFTRAVRIPSRAERDLDASPFAFLPPAAGGPALLALDGTTTSTAESVLAYEVGFRVKPFERLIVDVTGFYNDYDDIVMYCRGGTDLTGVIPTVLSSACNDLQGQTYGVELVSTLQVTDWWQLKGNYSAMKMDLSYVTPNTSLAILNNQKYPQHKFEIRSHMNFFDKFEFDAAFRFFDDLYGIRSSVNPTFFLEAAPAYKAVDARFLYRASDNIKASIVVQNLFANRHYEHPTHAQLHLASQIQTSVYGRLDIDF